MWAEPSATRAGRRSTARWSTCHGGHIRCATHLAEGQSGSIRLDSFARALPFTVRGWDGVCLHVQFELAPDLRATYETWFNAHVAPAGAVGAASMKR